MILFSGGNVVISVVMVRLVCLGERFFLKNPSSLKLSGKSQNLSRVSRSPVNRAAHDVMFMKRGDELSVTTVPSRLHRFCALSIKFSLIS